MSFGARASKGFTKRLDVEANVPGRLDSPRIRKSRPPEKCVSANRRHASPLRMRQQFGGAPHAPPCSPAVVADRLHLRHRQRQSLKVETRPHCQSSVSFGFWVCDRDNPDFSPAWTVFVPPLRARWRDENFHSIGAAPPG